MAKKPHHFTGHKENHYLGQNAIVYGYTSTRPGSDPELLSDQCRLIEAAYRCHTDLNCHTWGGIFSDGPESYKLPTINRKAAGSLWMRLKPYDIVILPGMSGPAWKGSRDLHQFLVSLVMRDIAVFFTDIKQFIHSARPTTKAIIGLIEANQAIDAAHYRASRGQSKRKTKKATAYVGPEQMTSHLLDAGWAREAIFDYFKKMDLGGIKEMSDLHDVIERIQYPINERRPCHVTVNLLKPEHKERLEQLAKKANLGFEQYLRDLLLAQSIWEETGEIPKQSVTIKPVPPRGRHKGRRKMRSLGE